jgi:thiol-disulfide isomerase/thioredoxin
VKKLAALVLAWIILAPRCADAGTLSILDFYSQSCPPCRAMRPEVEALRKAKYPVQSIDAEQQSGKAERFGVERLPTFLIVDERGQVLARTEGYRPAKEIADLYNKAVEKQADRDDDPAEDPRRQDGDGPVPDQEDPDRAPNPEPWKSIVRFQINDPHTKRIGFGSGTIIDSNDQESIILTCAHLFKIEGSRRQYAPADFPLEVTVELFDGVGRGRNKTVLPVSKLRGKVMDYDFATDVALVKVRPGRKLPYSKVVPTSWQPKQGMKMTTVGCSLGNDPTAWTTTILKPLAPGPDPNYRGMECVYSPKQGRSGGGIFTSDGYVAGVCDFASYTNSGLYARPESIHRLLDRKGLTALYDPKNGRDTYIAREKDGKSPPRGRASDTLVADRNGDGRAITLPKPELLGIAEPTSSYETVGVAWRATPVSHPRSSEQGPRVELVADEDDAASATRPAARRTTVPPPAKTTDAGTARSARRDHDQEVVTREAQRPNRDGDSRVGEWQATPSNHLRGVEPVGR